MELRLGDPAEIGTRLGGRIWKDAVGLAAQKGWDRIVICADTFAESFYRQMGAVWTGEMPSSSIAGRMLPLLRYDLP